MPAERTPLADDFAPRRAAVGGHAAGAALARRGARRRGDAGRAGGAVTVNGLTFKTSRLDLLNPRSEYNQRWLAYLAEFGDRDDACSSCGPNDRPI